MQNKINEKLTQLSEEAEELINERANIQQRLDDINIRLQQIVGAMQELDSLLQMVVGNNEVPNP